MLIPALLIILLLLLVIRQLRKLEIPDLVNKAVFITGCDSGFGHGLALKCLSRGMPVFAGCLTQTGADSLRKEARNLPGRLEAIIVDVANDDSVAIAKEVLEEKTKAFGGLHGLVNNAGIVGSAFIDDLLTLDDYKKTVVDQIWNRSSPELKSAFGRQFVDDSQAKYQKFLDSISSDRVDLVVDAYFHALTARFPLVRYQVGADSKYLWRPLSLLPTRLQDLLFEVGESTMGAPIPAGLQKKNV